MKRLIGLAVVVVLLIAAMWFAGWDIYRANVAQQREANHASQQWQDAAVAQVRSGVQGYDAATNPAQKQQIAATLCAIYLDIENPPTDLVQASVRICE